MNELVEKLIVHGAHHKMGTVWMSTTLRQVCEAFGLTFVKAPQRGESAQPPTDADVYFDGHSRFDLDALPDFRGSHMVRDLRDVVVSGYHYHLWTKEPWANRPLQRGQWKRFGHEQPAHDMTYVELLNSLPREEALHVEIRRLIPECQQLRDWDFGDPRFTELHFEDMMTDGDRLFGELFRWYGFDDRRADWAAEIAMRRHVSKIKDSGADTPHVRSGRAGQWVEVFSDAHKEAAKEVFGDLLVRMGYAEDLDW